MADFLALVASQRRFNFKPGTQHEYSHSDFELLGLIVERAVREPFGAYIEREVMRPLGMTDSRVADSRGIQIRARAIGHIKSLNGFRVEFNNSVVIGGGNLYASIEDLLHWDRALAEGASGKRPLSTRMLTRPTLPNGDTIPYAYGLRKGNYRGLPSVSRGVSRRFIRASADALRQFHTRRHDDREWLVLLLDGKTFADDQVVIALGVTRDVEKRVLGLVQTATENKRTCATFVRELVERGFTAPQGLLIVLDGAKGLRAEVRDVFGDDVAVQRCQWHKRENVLSYLPKSRHAEWRRKLQAAYSHGAYADAKRALQRLVSELTKLNESAARSLKKAWRKRSPCIASEYTRNCAAA